jgi:lipid II:glycine glycyltransferase (peptidoglycan interpeptide bridge formation enzyme)
MLWCTLSRVQILWIEGLKEHSLQQRKTELRDIVYKYNPLFVQLGSVDVLSVTTRQHLQDELVVQHLASVRKEETAKLEKQWFSRSLKENLSPSTYLVDIQQDEEALLSKLWSQHMQKIKKAQKNGIQVTRATMSDYEWFYTILEATGDTKWFGIISKLSYYRLLQRLEDNQCWWLYIAKQWDIICAGAIYLTDTSAQTCIYLYGATDRSFANIWASHLLHWSARKLLHKAGMHTADLLGWWPTGDKKHHLYNVWAFKEWFGGKKVDFLWSFDIVYKPVLYMIWRWLRKIRN